ncbi:protein tyrosine phosphatase [Hyphomicrobium methylovorum]|uniref:fused DSP-PTPase phosphatase/NAD kinase-like protein n=1 Tax=Hyphomicrobium methylovorum TaxID=84 RepID=UPI0015E65C0B|nr:sulfur transferase domain-containing protein [Hyphomicrobium methylovorum]MBA2126859.1 protein tyrosine phosphatase [Hyphomicrobium methylovorum]
MASLIKQAKRGLRRKSTALLQGAVGASPGWVRSRFAPALCYGDMLVMDYGIARVLYNNRHRISDDIWRSAQPAPHHVAWIAKRGIRTIVNLRSEQTFGTRWLEQQACARHGIAFVDLMLKSRDAPTRADFLAMRSMLERVEYPILVHCKSGADRAGLMSAVALLVHEGLPVRKAKEQLSLRFGHIRSADTGVLDAVFDRYLQDEAKTGIGFWEWVETVYDAKEVNQSFKANGWANRLVNGLLRRE